MLLAGACAVISRRKAIPSISCSVLACSTQKAATLSTDVSSFRAAKAEASSTSTVAVSLPPSHQFLPGSKGGLFAWESVRQFPAVILVEGLFDLAVLWQTGFRHTTCSLGTHLNAEQ